MARYRELAAADMNPAQKAVVDEIVSGKRGRFGGPFQLLIRSPEVCKHLSRLGEYLRWGSSLSPALSELAICLTARHIRANYEWHAHAPLAVEGDARGLEHVLSALAATASSDAASLDLPTLEATNLHTASLVLASAALLREESRGCHRRSDFAAPDPAFAQPLVLRIMDGQVVTRAGAMVDA